jgi:hypothetical protein
MCDRLNCTAPTPRPTFAPTALRTGLLKDACGLPFGCLIEPLATPADGLPLCAAAGPSPLPLLARCRHCYAYINRFCELASGGFTCSLCGKATGLGGGPVAARYLKQLMARDLLPELACSVYEVDVGDADDRAAAAAAASGDARDAWAAAAANGGGGGPLRGAGRGSGLGRAPAYIAVVDAAGDEDFLDLVSLRWSHVMTATRVCKQPALGKPWRQNLAQPLSGQHNFIVCP